MAARDGARGSLSQALWVGPCGGLGLAALVAWAAPLAQAQPPQARPSHTPSLPPVPPTWGGLRAGGDGLWPAELPKAGPWPGPGLAPELEAVERGRRFFLEHSFGATMASIPVALWRALEAESPHFSPEAQGRDFGLIRLPGRALPVGFTPAPAAGVERVTFNCALCHVGLVEGRPWLGQPNTALRLQELEERLMATLAEEGGPDWGAKLRQHSPQMGWAEEVVARAWVAIASRQAKAFRPSPKRFGPGRFDLLQRFKARLKLPAHDLFAPMDIPALYGARLLTRYPRDGALGGDMALIRFLIVRFSGDSADLTGGQVPPWVHDLNALLTALEPPPHPKPLPLEAVRQGQAVFTQRCAPCHGRYEAPMSHPNAIVGPAVVGTDPVRLRVWDPAAIAYAQQDPVIKRLDLHLGEGFVPPSLRGVWATAPYLHPGSVPTLQELLGDGTDRPQRFARGPGVGHDGLRGGLAWAQAPASAFVLDTTLPGNGAQGHLFGASLNPAERSAVMAYLQSL